MRQHSGSEGDEAKRGQKEVGVSEKGPVTMSVPDFEEEGMGIPVQDEVLE